MLLPINQIGLHFSVHLMYVSRVLREKAMILENQHANLLQLCEGLTETDILDFSEMIRTLGKDCLFLYKPREMKPYKSQNLA